MMENECDETVRLLNKSLSKYKRHLSIKDFGYYIYITSPREGIDDKIVTVIHGYGTSTEPYNIKFLATRHERDFFTFRRFKNYLKNEFYIDLVSQVL